MAISAPTTAPAEAGRRRSRWPVTASGQGGSATGLGRAARSLEPIALAVLAYVPLLAARPGVVTSDTKTYLYLDPGRFLAQVAHMWDPSVGLGTVTHEYIGYLWPMGPFFWLASAVDIPVWVAQRLWLGSILLAAGAGVLYLCRVLALRGPGRMVAALAFMLSPYFLQYAGRISVILLPWAGLPWLLALAVLALRRGGWRYPALFALVVATISGINASSVLYVGVAPALWLVWSAAVERQGTWRQAVGAALRIAALSFLCSMWWIAGLAVEAGFGVDVLRYTETIAATTQTSSAAEVIRGLGYWYFYGSDRKSLWTGSVVLYTQQLWLLTLSYLVPALGFAAAVLTRWRHRAFFVLLVVVGVVLSVGAFPYGDPTPFGGVLKSFMSGTTAGLALRSTDRATPLVVLGLAVLLGAGATALWHCAPRIGVLTSIVLVGLVIANNPAVFDGNAEVSSFFTQPASLPGYQMAAIRHLNATHPGTRVLAIPGNDFASYRWGDTVDTPQPAYLDRPFVTHEQQIMGSTATADTLYALDEPIQRGTKDWRALAPMARLLSAGDVLVEYDQAYEHYGTPHPKLLAAQLAATPPGLSDPVAYGKPRPNVPAYSTLDEADLGAPSDLPSPPPEVSYTVDGPRPITRAESDQGAVVVSGDATGLEQLAAAGLLDTRSAIYYSGTLDSRRAERQRLVAGGAQLVVTDTNRKQAFEWNTLTGNTGAIETPQADPAAHDPRDSPVDLFPGAPASARTTASYTGAVSVSASSYGNTVSYFPENRAYRAIDGDTDTAWETGVFMSDPVGQWWQVRFADPVTADHVTLVQPLSGNLDRSITRVTLRFDGGHPVDATLGPSSRTATGQVLTFPARSFHTLRITIDATTDDHVPSPAATEVGLAEVSIPGQHVAEVVDMPTDLVDATGQASLADRLTYAMTRDRVAASTATRTDPEAAIVRRFTVPTTRTFTLSGTASISALVPDDQIDRLLGRPGSDGSGIVAYSRGRLPGALGSGAAAALDGNPATSWQPGFSAGQQHGDWLEYDLPHSITFDHLDLQVVADGRHSVPTKLRISTEQGSRTVTLPAITDKATPGATTTVPVDFASLSGRHVRVAITGVRIERSTNFNAPSPIALPLGIAEVGLPGERIPPPPPELPGTCQSNLLTIDGQPVSVRVVGSTTTAERGGDVAVIPCGPDAGGITLAAGSHLLQTAPGHSPTTGWNIDDLVLDSAPGGGPEPPAGYGSLPAAQPGPSPSVSVTDQSTDSEQLRVRGATEPFELVLGQSVDAGWTAVATPGPAAPAGSHAVDLGRPQLVDGFANGWQVTTGQLQALGAVPSTASPGSSAADVIGGRPAAATSGSGAAPAAAQPFTVTLTWAPQLAVWVALGVSAATVVFCLVVGVPPTGWWRRRRRRRRGRHAAGGDHRSSGGGSTEAAGPPGGAVPTNGASASAAASAPPAGALAAAEPPTLSLPGRGAGRRPRLWVVAAASVLTGLAALAVSSPLAALGAFAGTALALLIAPVRAAVSLAAVGLLVAAAVTVVAGQASHPMAAGSEWPAAYRDAGALVLAAVVLLGADAVIDVGRWPGRRGRRADSG